MPRYTNIQLINTIGVAKADMRECLECWCKVRESTDTLFTVYPGH